MAPELGQHPDLLRFGVDDPVSGWTAWPAPAKVNRFLRIVGRRDDGYHLLQTVFQLLDWGDTIYLRPRKNGNIVRASTGPAYGVEAQDDLVVRAATLLREAAAAIRPDGLEFRLGVDIRVDKQIPLGGGFGGGSSDAATVLCALNLLWSTELPLEQLAGLGLQLGADVPVFVRGRSALAEGVGELLQPLELPRRWFLLIDAGIHVNTGDLFQDPELTRDALPLKIGGLVDENALETAGNAFESLVLRRSPELARLFERLREDGVPRLTGTGGGSFLVFDTREAAEMAALRLPGWVRSVVARGLDRSPMVQKLDSLAAGQK